MTSYKNWSYSRVGIRFIIEIFMFNLKLFKNFLHLHPSFYEFGLLWFVHEKLEDKHVRVQYSYQNPSSPLHKLHLLH